MSELSKVLLEYAEKFGENFPTRMVTMKEDKLIQVVRGCIDKNEPYIPEDINPESDY